MDELIKQLRQLAEEQMFDFERKPYLQAADAIEKLSNAGSAWAWLDWLKEEAKDD